MPDTLSCAQAVRAHSHLLGEKETVEGSMYCYIEKIFCCPNIFTVVYIKGMKMNLTKYFYLKYLITCTAAGISILQTLLNANIFSENL